MKYHQDGSVSKFKAILMAQGFTQTLGVDYFDICSLVVISCTIHEKPEKILIF